MTARGVVVASWVFLGCAAPPAATPAADAAVVAPVVDASAAPDAGPAADAGTGAEEEPTRDEAFAEALTGHRRRHSLGDLPDIRREGALRIITRNNATSYFLYKGREAGFHYEVAQLLARELGLRLQVVVPPSRRDLIPYLLEGRGDIVLTGLSVDSDRVERVALTGVTLESPWAVVLNRRLEGAVKALPDLRGRELVVSPSSGALRRVRALDDAQKLGLRLRAAVETQEQEDLLDLVEDGEVDGAVLEERVATVELASRPHIFIALRLPGDPDRQAWAVRKDNPELLAAAKEFLVRHRRGTDWNILDKRYHEPSARTEVMREPRWRADKDGAITPWDREFKAAGRDAQLDWRLLAAQAYQESRFDPKARSHMGAVGLMQLMPSLARSMGVHDMRDPLDSLRAGARYMKKLVGMFEQDGVKLKDQVRFALASYNAGRAHVEDARALAKRTGRDPNRWFDNVAIAMQQLSKPKFYRKARYGFCRGEEPVKYVSQIQGRYDAYVALTER